MTNIKGCNLDCLLIVKIVCSVWRERETRKVRREDTMAVDHSVKQG